MESITHPNDGLDEAYFMLFLPFADIMPSGLSGLRNMMNTQTFLYITIILFGSASYCAGLWKMLTNQYSPSTFSRVVWVLLAINSFASVVLSDSSSTSILLAAVMLAGNIAICITSFWKGNREVGRMEYICIALLIVSALVWVFFKAPLVNLMLSLFGHFVGAGPTYKKVIRNPESEDLMFWLLFFIASVLSIFVCHFTSFTAIILPLYYALFDGSIVVLILREKIIFFERQAEKQNRI